MMTRRPTRLQLVTIVYAALLRTPLLAIDVDDSSESISAEMNEPVDANEYDDRTLLDTFGEVAKQFLTRKVIPETDAACKWDWRYVRCEPICECEFQPRRGDYHLGRACRAKDKENCDPTTSVPAANPAQLMIQRGVQGSQKVLNAARDKVQTGYDKVQTNVCQSLPELTCAEELPVLAWQERILCRHKIPDCSKAGDLGHQTDDILVQSSQ
jgi:hypothetical protein